jgi:glycosyltransferase involved in cell wall biosynthesis
MTETASPTLRPRLCIFVIAYYAESTLRAVLERIPPTVFGEYDTEVLVVDDASEDRTFAIGQDFRREHPQIRMTVLRNEYNQGYGGNQKVGYAHAISEGFDFVAMLHGDGQYAPEELPRLLVPLRDGAADAVFGSRMIVPRDALRGGMPLYKFVGNRVLTTIQNALLGTRLSEFHSGYRIYSVRALRDLRFRLNSNDFHFDTEIIIQLLNARKRIVELPIPTYYGSEICRVNGLKYAGNVMMATLRNWFHRTRLLYQRRFEPANETNLHYDLKLGYPSSHSMAIAAVPSGARVIDIGAGPAGVAGELVKKGCDVAVVDRYMPQQPDRRVTVYVQDLDAPLTFDARPYEYILLLDIIEHLRDPEDFIARLRSQFDHTPRRVILTTPNIAFLVQRVMLMLGQFNYGREGILDRTHTRLFTFRGVRHLLRDAGFRIRSVRGVPAPFPKVLGNGWLGRTAVALNQLLIRVSRSLFAYQIYVEADSTPDVDFVLADTRRHSDAARMEPERKDAAGR